MLVVNAKHGSIYFLNCICIIRLNVLQRLFMTILHMLLRRQTGLNFNSKRECLSSVPRVQGTVPHEPVLRQQQHISARDELLFHGK